jgi:hypothetical protein
VLIQRVSTAGIGVLCQLECEGRFRAEVLRWMPGYCDPDDPEPSLDDPEPSLDDPEPSLDDDEPDGARAGTASPGS